MQINFTGELFDANADEIIRQIDENKGEHIDLFIDSPGGNVFAGLRIISKIQEHGDVTALCGVIVASIASVIAFSCKDMKFTENTFMMIHYPWVSATGNAEELLNTVDLLEKAGDRIKAIIEAKAKTPVAVEDWLKKEYWFVGSDISANFNDATQVDNIAYESDDDHYTSVAMAAKIKGAPEAITQMAAKLKVEQEKKINDVLEEEARKQAEAEMAKKAEEAAKKIDNSFAQSILDKAQAIIK